MTNRHTQLHEEFSISYTPMAEKLEKKGKSLEDMEKEITCAICQEHYTEPKVLPCLHYYCKKCVLRLALRTASNKPFSCPECRKDTTLPEGGVDQLKTAFFINRFKSNYYALERVHGKVEVRCEVCADSTDTSEAFCRQCAAFICKKCVESHKRMKMFASHEVASLEDLKQGRAREIAVREPPTKKCNLHEEPLTVFCFDCSSLVCRDCTVKIHKDHSFEFSKIAAPSTKKNLLEDLAALKDVTSTLSESLKDIQTAKQEIEDQGSAVVNVINNSFAELQLILEERKQQLLQEATCKVREKVEKLSVQEKSLSLAKAEVQSVVESTERFLDHCSDNEVMNMHAEIKKNIKHSIAEHGQSKTTAIPSEEADVGVEVASPASLHKLCQTETRITRLPLDLQCTVTGERLETAELHQTVDLTLTTRLSNGKKTSPRVVNVAGELKSLCDGSVVQCGVHQLGAGKYRIQYMPTVRGRHQLTVSVNGQEIADSPFPVSVSISPTLLGQPVKIVTVPVPSSVIVNSEGELLVCLCNSRLVNFDKEGKMHTLVNFNNQLFPGALAIATDNEDKVYCVSTKSNKIFYCDKNGGDIQVHEVQQVKGPGHYGVAVVGDEVMVTEQYNASTIMIYDKQFKYVRRIQQTGDRKYGRLSVNTRDNNLYVAASDHLIHVLSKDGILLRSFGCDIDGVERLNLPSDICISGEYVYVCNCNGHNVSVFTTSGDYVTSFGRQGNKEGEFRRPYSITVDLNNYIIVADTVSKRVQYF